VVIALPPSQGGPPAIYISPNGDHVQDSMALKLSVDDEQSTIAGWTFTIEDRSSGKIVRTITATSTPPEKLNSLKALRDGLLFTKKDVVLPDMLTWDGADDQGNPVPEGTYIVSFHAWDDRGNINVNYDSSVNVVVDRTPPVVNAWVLAPEQLMKGDDPMIFSPDGDNSKDTIAFRVQGSVEDNWKYEVLNGNGIAVRTVELKERSAPRDFIWDGTNDMGARVPDGSYQFRVSTRDAAGSEGSKVIGTAIDKSDWIVLDTSRPKVEIAAAKKAFSPRKEDDAGLNPLTFSLETTKNLISWKEFVQDENGKMVLQLQGDATSQPPSTIAFKGVDAKGNPLPDGHYRAGVELVYRNGFSPLVFSDPFLLDATPPSATVVLDDVRPIFSPDGDGQRDTLAFAISGSKENLWNIVIKNAEGI